jgi:mRNA deadenylase 3'-5' endonuclease subunit Ccr4
MQVFGERAQVPTPTTSASAAESTAATVRVTSYNVLADCNAGSLTYDGRKDKLLHEMISTKPHIIALQDVEMYDEFWRPRLNKAGFDTVYKQRTSAVSFKYWPIFASSNED